MTALPSPAGPGAAGPLEPGGVENPRSPEAGGGEGGG